MEFRDTANTIIDRYLFRLRIQEEIDFNKNVKARKKNRSGQAYYHKLIGTK